MSQAPACIGPHPNPRKPDHELPYGSTDCHCHVFEDPKKYPLVENRSYTPSYLPLERYLAMSKTVGLTRTVQVNASVYGFDNSLSLDIIAALGQDQARGVAGVRPDVSERDLHRLHDGGFRGARLSTHVKGYGGTDVLDTIAAKVARLDWHVQLHVGNNAEIAQLEAKLMELPSAIVFDHLGCVRGERDTVDSPGFQALLRILKARDDCWSRFRAGTTAPKQDRPTIPTCGRLPMRLRLRARTARCSALTGRIQTNTRRRSTRTTAISSTRFAAGFRMQHCAGASW
jgi:2-pyrone-4,6-dicarboxylate lactonase